MLGVKGFNGFYALVITCGLIFLDLEIGLLTGCGLVLTDMTIRWVKRSESKYPSKDVEGY